MICHDVLKQCMTCAMQDHIKITEHLFILHFPHLCIELYNARNTTWKRLSFSTRRRRVLALERRSRRLRDGKKGGLELSKAVKDTFLHWPIWPIVGRCLVTGTWWAAHNQVFLLESTQILHLVLLSEFSSLLTHLYLWTQSCLQQTANFQANLIFQGSFSVSPARCLQLAITVDIQNIKTLRTSAIRAIRAIYRGAGIQHLLSLVLTIRVILNPGDCRECQAQAQRKNIEQPLKGLSKC